MERVSHSEAGGDQLDAVTSGERVPMARRSRWGSPCTQASHWVLWGAPPEREGGGEGAGREAGGEGVCTNPRDAKECAVAGGVAVAWGSAGYAALRLGSIR
jgi:hypothetical protein